MVPGSFWKVPGEGAERNTEWTRAAWAKLEPHTEDDYVNLGESQQDVHAHPPPERQHQPRLTSGAAAVATAVPTAGHSSSMVSDSTALRRAMNSSIASSCAASMPGSR